MEETFLGGVVCFGVRNVPPNADVVFQFYSAADYSHLILLMSLQALLNFLPSLRALRVWLLGVPFALPPLSL